MPHQVSAFDDEDTIETPERVPQTGDGGGSNMPAFRANLNIVQVKTWKITQPDVEHVLEYEIEVAVENTGVIPWLRATLNNAAITIGWRDFDNEFHETVIDSEITSSIGFNVPLQQGRVTLSNTIRESERENNVAWRKATRWSCFMNRLPIEITGRVSDGPWKTSVRGSMQLDHNPDCPTS